VRVGHTVPSHIAVTVRITQGTRTHTWSSYQFGQFSGWVNAFIVGKGLMEVWQVAGGGGGGGNGTVPSGPPAFHVEIPLTPGPLVVVIKDELPLSKPTNVETIAASFVPPKDGSAVRLFNLAPDVKSAGLNIGAGKLLVDHVQYSLGSTWHPVESVSTTFTAVDDAGNAGLHPEVTMTPPLAPQVFTTFLLGSKEFGYTLVPQVDAPEYGVCKPSFVEQQRRVTDNAD
jgi:hypothetical protein